MTDSPILYTSTNQEVPPATLRQALLRGQPADRGLYLPERLPSLSPAVLASLVRRSYPEIAAAVLRPFTAGTFDETRLRACCEEAYDFAVPLERVAGRRHVMRLDRGPTASFKDFAARLMARWMGALMEEEEGELLVLTATSGDTGGAVAHAFRGVERVRVAVLFPLEEVSDRQRRQMTTLGGNIAAFAVEGKFDDCQAMVKRAFADPDLGRIRLTSANSINVGRLLPQSVYYVYAYLKLAAVEEGQPITFSIPCGNFGDLMGGVLAREMGIPIERMVVATNANDEVPRYLASGRYEKIVPSRNCLSNAMNVGHPSNLARLVAAYGGRMDDAGVVHRPPDLERMRRDLYAVAIDDEETRAAIREAYRRHGLLLEPHGAVAWAGLERYLSGRAEGGDPLAVSLETAHPAKFPEEIRSLLGIEPNLPPSLAGIDGREERYEQLAPEYEPFKALLRERYRR